MQCPCNCKMIWIHLLGQIFRTIDFIITEPNIYHKKMLNFGSDADITRIKIAAVLEGNKKFCENKIKILVLSQWSRFWPISLIVRKHIFPDLGADIALWDCRHCRCSGRRRRHRRRVKQNCADPAQSHGTTLFATFSGSPSFGTLGRLAYATF